MSINNNIGELAEAYVSGSLRETEVLELKSRLETDTVFANEFYEMTNLIRSFQGSGKQKRFRSMLRDITTSSKRRRLTKRPVISFSHPSFGAQPLWLQAWPYLPLLSLSGA